MYRRDACRWSYVKLFLASITFGLPRFILVWIWFGICLLGVSLFSIGVKVTDETYITGTRRYLLNKTVAIVSWLILTTMGLRIRNKVMGPDEIDYSHYLGPNWKRELRERKTPVPKIISPHVSCFDIQVLLTLFGGNCSFVAGDFIKKVPILGSIAVKLGTVFVPRSGKADALTNVLSSMTRRTQLIEQTGEFPTLIVFPEGTCTNNTTLTKFRRGAFMDERAVLPVTIKYHHGMVHPAIESLSEPHMVFLLACTVGIIDIEVI
mmetsp:Transcript_31707/g.37186  ORF Transcript_31707/g.37186 Transcript_31707/m.37186 type:complete len:264 (+) Transcript_31707:160-951(+)